MKSTDFVKNYGIDRAKKLLAITEKMNMSGLVFVSLKHGNSLDFEVGEMKQLIASHDLINSLGGYEKVKKFLSNNRVTAGKYLYFNVATSTIIVINTNYYGAVHIEHVSEALDQVELCQ